MIYVEYLNADNIDCHLEIILKLYLCNKKRYKFYIKRKAPINISDAKKE